MPAMSIAPTPAPAPKHITDDVSLVVVLLDTNPYFWSSSPPSLSFSLFLSHVLSFVNSILLLNQLNQVLIIATGYNSCGYVFDSSEFGSGNQSSGGNAATMPGFCEEVIRNLDEFLSQDEKLSTVDSVYGVGSSLLSGALSMAMCYIQRVFRSGPLHPQPRVDYMMKSALGKIPHCNPDYSTESSVVELQLTQIVVLFLRYLAQQILCLHGSPDGPEQYVSVMNAIFSAQRSMVPIDSCVVGAQHSAFLQQASYITGGVYLKPQQLDGLFQYLAAVFATDLHSRNFIQLPKPVGVDFRASCFCHKSTIDMGFICSVCLSIFCTDQKKCSTCGSVFGRAKADASSATGQKRKDRS